MFSPNHNRTYIEQVYMMNGKNLEVTINMFCNEESLPVSNQETKIEVEVIDSCVKAETFEKAPRDMSAYVLEEYKDILFPKKGHIN